MLAINGIPLFYMELAIGQYLSLGTVGAWSAICPLARGKLFDDNLLNFFFFFNEFSLPGIQVQLILTKNCGYNQWY